ncbi:MAG: hypothetical protein KDA27_06570 [Candidatus Eisenbacteria bacterium]|uniref:Uncharacterized protein n=1 Tax=Eiseniibacteriota bacterium TaxID=2212470 RepID=A0A956NBV3_UNCEI|nr:hypothetical protein [Candidatus Eisenbacteria bacterium]MCB9465504.1 hypothetical protein [Candidatus Eisenbacteria bacterium]
MSPPSLLPVPGTPVDGHVHFYSIHDLRTSLDAAVGSMKDVRINAAKGSGLSAVGVLCLTEDARHDAFSGLAEGRIQVPEWSIVSTGEAEALWATRSDGTRLLILAGYQVVTAEGLEVLALRTSVRPKDGAVLDSTTRSIAQHGGLAVLPWAFGKWWFGRGRVLIGHLASPDRVDLYLGDNGGRPSLLPGAEPYALAGKHGLVVLPGSDPLPIPGHEVRTGSYGFVLEGEVPEERPARWFGDAVASLSVSPPTFGARVSLGQFVRDQAALRKGSAGPVGSSKGDSDLRGVS